MSVTATSRDRAIAEICRWRRVAEEVEGLEPTATGGASYRLSVHADLARQELERACRQYLETVPDVPIARSPHTQAVVHYAIDTDSFDGPWWDSEGPVRPALVLPREIFALTGATRLEIPAPQTDHVVLPGPGAPYVIPRLLAHGGIKAVMSGIAIGASWAWVICYFAPDPAPAIPRANTWGLSSYIAFDETGRVTGDSIAFDPADYDFDLAPHINAGALLWIAPRDPELRLRTTAADCPYLDLAGPRQPVRLYRGEAEPWSRV